MHVVVAPQEFKGTLSATEAAESIAAALAKVHPDWSLDILPMADGGPGTLDALLRSAGGTRNSATVLDPLFRPVEAEWAQLRTGEAVVECAAASGLWRLSEGERDARLTSTYGTGQLLRAALGASPSSVIIGLGGSATNDGGAGMAQALGFRFLDRNGADLDPGGAALIALHRIVPPTGSTLPKEIDLLAAIDVSNPLCGPHGASRVFGPQKGADEEAVALLERAMERLASVISSQLGVAVSDLSGAGAAGGLGAGLFAFLGARLVPGAALVAEAAGLAGRIASADLVLTGEGRLDSQSLSGKASVHVARLARSLNKPVYCLAGSLGNGAKEAAREFSRVEVTAGVAPGKAEASRLLADLVTRVLGGLVS